MDKNTAGDTSTRRQVRYNQGMGNKRSIVAVVKKVKLTDQKKDAEFWRTQPHSARIAALEEIRSEYAKWKYNAKPGFQRVCRIIKR